MFEGLQKKKGKYSGIDTDKDGFDDQWEVDNKRHSEDNKPRHIVIGGTLPSRGGIIAIHHDNLNSSIGSVNKKHGLRMNEPRPIKLSMDIKQNKMYKMREIRIPKAEMSDEFMNIGQKFQMDYVNDHIDRILKKRKKKYL